MAVTQARPRKLNRYLSAMARREERFAWILVIPTILVVVGVAIYPLLNTFYVTFFQARLGSARAWEFVGLDNYARLLSNPKWWEAVLFTIQFTVATVALETLFGLIIALVVNSKFPGRGLMRTAMLVPWAMITVVSAQMWVWMFNDVFGVINDLFFRVIPILPEKIAWVANASTAGWSLVAIDVWKTTPFMALLLLAGLQMMSADLYEAASVDGAGPIRQFFSITLPLLRPALVVALIFRTLDALRVFDLVWVATGGSFGTETMSTFARRNLVDFQQLGFGSAIMVAIFVVIAIFVILYVTLIMKDEEA